MATNPTDLARHVEAATERLLATVAGLDDEAVRERSPLPGWTRGHVLSHIARNADGLVHLLEWTRGGRTPMYASREARDADIDRGAGRCAADLLADVRDSAGRFTVAAAAVPTDGWDTLVEWSGGRTRPAAHIPWRRLVEVEVHHADLDAGYGPDDWPEPFAEQLLAELVEDLPTRADAPALTVHADGGGPVRDDARGPVVSGTPAALVRWLAGRSTGAGLTVHPAGQVPALPRWR